MGKFRIIQGKNVTTSQFANYDADCMIVDVSKNKTYIGNSTTSPILVGEESYTTINSTARGVYNIQLSPKLNSAPYNTTSAVINSDLTYDVGNAKLSVPLINAETIIASMGFTTPSADITTLNSAEVRATNNLIVGDEGELMGSGDGNVVIAMNYDNKALDVRNAKVNIDTNGANIEMIAGVASLYMVDGEISIDANKVLISSDVSISGNLYSKNSYTTSDERLKDFKDDIYIDFNQLKNVPKKYFNFKDNDKQEIGTSAQAIQKIYPEVVSEDASGYLSVDYSKLSIIALAAIDKLNERINTLETELASLKK